MLALEIIERKKTNFNVRIDFRGLVPFTGLSDNVIKKAVA